MFNNQSMLNEPMLLSSCFNCLGSSSRGQPRGALPLHQVTQRQFIKFADPMRRSGHNNLLHELPRRVHITR
jgi:hypothetical protein